MQTFIYERNSKKNKSSKILDYDCITKNSKFKTKTRQQNVTMQEIDYY